ncbi:MAG TPA: PKD domain-containing protein [Gammaproteobacteria bacterium]
MTNLPRFNKHFIQFTAVGFIVTAGLLSIIGTGSNTSLDTTTACIGKSQHIRTGTWAMLDGRCSDFTNLATESDYMDYYWRLVSKPAGSAAFLTGFTLLDNFVADVDGEYVVELTTTTANNRGNKTSTRITAYTSNAQPVAEAGAYQEVAIGDTVQLNGTATDADDNTLSYSWNFQPGSATSTLSSTTSAATSFVANSDTDYTLDLIANDGAVNSQTNSVLIRSKSSNLSLPVAVAGTDQYVTTGDQVTLNGLNSYSAYNRPLSYSWRMLYRPLHSNASLSDRTSAQPSFIADQPGAYLIRLKVNDGFNDSSRSLDDVYEDRVVVIAGSNQLPVADGGADQNVNTGTTVILNGSGTDPENATLTYAWSLIKQPTGSTASLSSLDTPTTQILPDRDGDYLVRLVVNDGTDDSAPDVVRVSTSSLSGATALTLVTTLPYPDSGEAQTWIQIDTDGSNQIGVITSEETTPANFSTAIMTNPYDVPVASFMSAPDWTFVSPASSPAMINDANTATFIVRRDADNVHYKITFEFTVAGFVQIDPPLQAWRCGMDPGDCP